MPAATYPDDLTRLRARTEARDARLRRLGYSSYRAYLDSPEWAAVRARYFASDLPQNCVGCKAEQPILLHHRTYERVGEEELTDLAPVCPTCHADIHTLEARGLIFLHDAEALRSESRSAKYAAGVEARRSRIQAETPAPGEGDVKRIVRALKTRLHSAAVNAARRGIDISEELEAVERAVAGIERKTFDS